MTYFYCILNSLLTWLFIYLFNLWHANVWSDLSDIVGSPELSDGFVFGVELEGLFSVKVLVSPKTTSGSSETEHWEWDWNWDIDTDLSDVDFVGEFSGGGTVVGENGGSVTVEKDSCKKWWVLEIL